MTARTVPFRDPRTGDVRQVAIPADSIPHVDKDGMLICFTPDYSIPSVYERVARAAFEDEVAANPPRGTLGYRLLAERSK